MGLYLKKKLENGATVAVWNVTETEDELKAMASVPSDEMEEISLFRNESTRKQKLAVRALLNELFEDKVYLSHHDNGKPYIENDATNISITHTDSYVAIILHKEEELGIDIEKYAGRDFDVVAKKALSAEELDDVVDPEDEDRSLQLAIYWCTKESIYKVVAQNSVNFATQIEVKRFNPKEKGEVDALFHHKDDYDLEFELEYITFDGHVLVWCVGYESE